MKKRSLVIEQLYPTAGAVVVCALVIAFGVGATLTKEIHEEFTAILNVSAIAVGFLGLTMSILLTIDKHWIMQRSRESTAYSLLVEYMISATFHAFVLALMSAGALLAAVAEFHWWQSYALALFWGWCAMTVLDLLRVFRVLSAIMRAVADPR
jgi:hypothetical protein